MIEETKLRQQITQYALSAICKSRYVVLEDGSYYADIPLCPGVWATGKTVQSCRDDLMAVLLEWLVVAYTGKESTTEATEASWLNPLWYVTADRTMR